MRLLGLAALRGILVIQGQQFSFGSAQTWTIDSDIKVKRAI